MDDILNAVNEGFEGKKIDLIAAIRSENVNFHPTYYVNCTIQFTSSIIHEQLLSSGEMPRPCLRVFFSDLDRKRFISQWNPTKVGVDYIFGYPARFVSLALCFGPGENPFRNACHEATGIRNSYLANDAYDGGRAGREKSRIVRTPSCLTTDH